MAESAACPAFQLGRSQYDQVSDLHHLFLERFEVFCPRCENSSILRPAAAAPLRALCRQSCLRFAVSLFEEPADNFAQRMHSRVGLDELRLGCSSVFASESVCMCLCTCVRPRARAQSPGL